MAPPLLSPLKLLEVISEQLNSSFEGWDGFWARPGFATLVL